MRPSKSRSRNKSNRNRSVGNVVNRVFDSSGPEGKVRGTPQQIIDKYTQLARDAQLGNDRVAFENFQQHAEHYQRMLNEAQREQDARREEHERQNRDRQTDRDRDRGPREGGPRQGEDQPADPARSAQPEIIEPADSGDSGLVETPETRGAARNDQRGENRSENNVENQGESKSDDTPPRKPARKPRSRRPAKPAGEGGQATQSNQDDQRGDGGPELSAGPTKAAE
jgi:hypothetical protein